MILFCMGSYGLGGEPLAVAVRPDGAVGVGAYGYVDGQFDAAVYVPGWKDVYRDYDFGSSAPGHSGLVQPGGMAFGSSTMLVVTGDMQGQALLLRAIVPRHIPSLLFSINKFRFAYGEQALLTVRLGRTTDRTVTISAKLLGTEREHVVRTGSVDDRGYLRVGIRVFTRTIFTVRFAGDDGAAPVSDWLTERVRARVTNSLRRDYEQVDGYHIYHVSVDPVLTTTVSPHATGSCVYFQGQAPEDGVWQTFAVTKCVHLDQAGHASVRLTGTHVVGERVRLRAFWNDHPANMGNQGPYQYARFTR